MNHSYNNSQKKFLLEEITDISSSSTFKSTPLKDDKYFILHHTAGRGKAQDVMNVLNSRRLGVQWIIDKEGKLYKSLPSGHRGAHIKMIKSSAPDDLSNRTAQGVEIIGKNDSDISETQCKTALQLIKNLGYPLSNIYGHGEVSSNKSADEGKTCKAYIKKYWSTPQSELPDSDKSVLKGSKGSSTTQKLPNLNLFGYDLSKITSDLKDKLAGLFAEDIKKSKLDLIIEREIKKYLRSNITESETYGFPEGKVDSGKVVKGGEGGNWGGSMEKALEIADIAKKCSSKAKIISQKRSRVKTASGNVSDHYEGNSTAYAVDIAASGKEGDELLACIMKEWDGGSNSSYKGGKWLNVNKDGYRYQFGWRVKDHYDHIHVGVKSQSGKSSSGSKETPKKWELPGFLKDLESAFESLLAKF